MSFMKDLNSHPQNTHTHISLFDNYIHIFETYRHIFDVKGMQYDCDENISPDRHAY